MMIFHKDDYPSHYTRKHLVRQQMTFMNIHLPEKSTEYKKIFEAMYKARWGVHPDGDMDQKEMTEIFPEKY